MNTSKKKHNKKKRQLITLWHKILDESVEDTETSLNDPTSERNPARASEYRHPLMASGSRYSTHAKK